MKSKRCPKCFGAKTLTLFNGADRWICGECSWVTNLSGEGLGYAQEIKEFGELEKRRAMETEQSAE